MQTAVDFLTEWAGEEAWKNHILNKAITIGDIDSLQLLDEVLHLIKTKGTVDRVPDSGRENLENKRLIINEIRTPKNINALSSDAQFSLGENLNVFYGENGSGKSSYVNRLKSYGSIIITIAM